MTLLPSLIEALEGLERSVAPDGEIVYRQGASASITCPEMWLNTVVPDRIDLDGTAESWRVTIGYEYFVSDVEAASAMRSLTICDQVIERLRDSGFGPDIDVSFVSARAPADGPDDPVVAFEMEFVASRSRQHAPPCRAD